MKVVTPPAWWTAKHARTQAAIQEDRAATMRREPYTGEVRACAYCGAPFPVKKHTRRGRHLHCQALCAQRARRA